MATREAAIAASVKVQRPSLRAVETAVEDFLKMRADPDVTELRLYVIARTASGRPGSFLVTRSQGPCAPTSWVYGVVGEGSRFVNGQAAEVVASLRDSLAAYDTLEAVHVSVKRQVFDDFHAYDAARATAGFLHDAREELMRRTWHPSRVVDWCLPHDEAAALRGLPHDDPAALRTAPIAAP